MCFKEKAHVVFCLKNYVFCGITGTKTEGNILEKLHKVNVIRKKFLKEQLGKYL